MFELAERLVGIYKVNHMTKSVTVENRDYLGLQRQALQRPMLAASVGVGIPRPAQPAQPTQLQVAGLQPFRPVSRDTMLQYQSPVRQSPKVQGKPVAHQLLVSPSQVQMQTDLEASVAMTEMADGGFDETGTETTVQ
jgi:hypothetical protein